MTYYTDEHKINCKYQQLHGPSINYQSVSCNYESLKLFNCEHKTRISAYLDVKATR